MSEPILPAGELSPVKQALLEIRRLRARLAQARALEPEPVAIVGMAVRFPGGIVRLDQFWNTLASGQSVVTQTPIERWDSRGLYDADPDRPGKTYSSHGGFLVGVDEFDAEFFGITPREAESMDPQHRILLELSWEALEHAGIAPPELAGTATGVFIGLCNTDYGRLLLETPNDIDAYSSFGLAGSLAAGRVSYFLDAKGPSLVVDTACSSSLMAVHLACLSLAARESSLAIVGGSNLILTPDVTISFSHARMLSPDGQCRSFDAAANGYVRGEGCAAVILKRLGQAQADGDRVLAVIRGSAANHDGRSAGVTAPNGPAQSAVIRAALARAGLEPAEVDYVEAHGTGTPLGDPIELQALAAAYGPGRPAERPLLIGSVKTNVGHLEAAAGLAGLVKVVLSLEHEALPAHRNFEVPTPHIAWELLPLSVVRTLRSWQHTGRPRRAGLSAFGFSGTNVHVIVEEAQIGPDPRAASPDRECLFVTSARSMGALRASASLYVSWLDQTPASLTDICELAAVGRAHHQHRLAVVARSRTELAASLKAWLADGGREVQVGLISQVPRTGILCPPISAADAQAAAVVLAGASAAFAAELKNFAEAIGPENTARSGDDPANAVALQYALGRLWTSIGLAPSVICGIGLGNVAAMSLAGLLTPREALARARDGRAAPAGTDELTNLAGLDLLLVLGHEMGSVPASCGARTPVLGASANSSWRGLLEALQAAYLAGASIDWRALYRPPGHDGPKPRLELPTYAFQRRRFWRPVQHSQEQMGDQAAVDWPKLVFTLAAQSETGPLGWDPGLYTARWRRLDQLTVGHAVNTLLAVGEFANGGARASADDIVRRHGFLPLYRGLIGRWLGLLARHGMLREEGNAFVSSSPLEPCELSELWREVRQLMADDPDTLTYIERASGKLPELLTGQVSPLEVLFERGSLDRAEGIYERSPSARYMNALVAAAVRSALEDHRGRGPFRLVEAGAGTGGTTALVAECFPQDGEYWFTDVSDAFLARARRKFGKNPAFRFAKFNLDLPPPLELPVGHADVVLAANVVHATRDVGATLDRMRALLKPGGLLILIESTTHHSHYDLTIAFVEGWSRFADAYRKDHPLLPIDRWTALLGERGFVETERFPKAGAAADTIGQHLLIGRNNPDPRPSDQTATLVAADPQPEVKPLTPVPQFEGAVTASRREQLERFVALCAAHVMHLDASTSPHRRDRFTELGMDSLMALQFQTLLADGLGLREQLAPTIVLQTGTVEALTDEILRVVEPGKAANGSHAQATLTAEPTRFGADLLTADELEAISDEEVAALLAQRIPAQTMADP